MHLDEYCQVKATRQIDPSFFNLLYPTPREGFERRKVLLLEEEPARAIDFEIIFIGDPDIELQIARNADEAMIHMLHTKYDLVVLENYHCSSSPDRHQHLYKVGTVAQIAEDIRHYFLSH